MGIIFGAIIIFVVLIALVGVVTEGAKGIGSRVIRPYVGLLLIAALIAVMGLMLGWMFRGIEDYFLMTAKGVTIFTGVILCLHLIAVIAKQIFAAD